MSETCRTLYHGTPSAVHETASGHIEPRLPNGGDLYDPKQPHIFLTPSLEMARIYSVKAAGCIGVSNFSDKGMHVMLFTSKPNDPGVGWVYTVDEPASRPFTEVLKRGQPSGEYVSF